MKHQVLCDICSLLVSEHNMDRHKKSAHFNVTYSCDKCDYVTKRSDCLRNHKETKHMHVRHYCDQCTKSFNNKFVLRKHIRAEHEGHSLVCEVCHYKAPFQSGLIKHMETSHPELAAQGQKVYLCDQCEFATRLKRYLDMHQKRMHQNFEMMCERCHYKTNSEYQFKLHIENYHQADPDKCVYCDYAAADAQDMKTHLDNNHEDIRNRRNHYYYKYTCDQCPFKTHHQPFLTKHIEVNHGTEELSCEHCDYKTMSPKDLKKHWLYRHKPGKERIPCDHCHFTATRADALKRHVEARHLGIRHSCSLCNYTTGCKSDLSKHKKYTHAETVTCDVCFKVYKAWSIEKHKRKAHNVMKYEN